MPRIYAVDALTDIIDYYTSINPNDIELFAPVAYPIARIEVTMNEESKEDFDVIQRSVLKFISLGYKSPNQIAAIMGLTGSYIEQIFKLLSSYGHIDQQSTITELGRQSLKENKKITAAKEVKRTFLMDALNCSIIRLSDNVDNIAIAGENNSEIKNLPFLEHSHGVKTKDIEAVLRKSEFRTLCAIPQSIDINVSKITDVKCLDIIYAKSYLLKIKTFSPMIFIKRYDFHNADDSPTYYWLPFSVNSQRIRDYLKKPDLPIHNDDVKNIIENLLDRIRGYGKSSRLHETITTALQQRNISAISSLDTGYITIVNSQTFQAYNPTNLYILYYIGKHGAYLYTDDNFFGKIVRFTVAPNDDLNNEIHKITDKITQLSNYKLFEINRKIRGYSNEPKNANKPYIKLVHETLDKLLSQSNSNE